MRPRVTHRRCIQPRSGGPTFQCRNVKAGRRLLEELTVDAMTKHRHPTTDLRTWQAHDAPQRLLQPCIHPDVIDAAQSASPPLMLIQLPLVSSSGFYTCFVDFDAWLHNGIMAGYNVQYLHLAHCKDMSVSWQQGTDLGVKLQLLEAVACGRFRLNNNLPYVRTSAAVCSLG